MQSANILIMEDESITALAIKHKLERLGYNVLAIESCSVEAVEKTQHVNPDLVLMDIVLEGEMDTIKAAYKIIRKFDIPVVYLTAYSSDKTPEKAGLTRPYGYVNKPFSERDLKNAVETALYKHQIECKLRQGEENLNSFLNAEEHVEKTNMYLRSLIEASLDPLVTIGHDGKITDVNSATGVMTGYFREHLIGTDFSEYFTPPEKAREAHQRVFKEGLVKGFELGLKHENGYITPVSYNASVYKNKDGEVMGAFAAARDITDLKNAENDIKVSLKEKEVLLREIHHRVKNNFQIISSLLSLQSGHITCAESFDVFMESQNRIRSMAMIHEKLYMSDSMVKIDFKEYVDDLTDSIFYNYKISPNMIRLNRKIDNVFFKINTAIPCGLIINELVTNCLKHAFPWFKDSKSLKDSSEILKFGKYKIDIELKQIDGNYILTVSDNGSGFPDDVNFRKTDSLGLQLVNSLVEQIDGTIKLDKTNDTKFRIIFKGLA